MRRFLQQQRQRRRRRDRIGDGDGTGLAGENDAGAVVPPPPAKTETVETEPATELATEPVMFEGDVDRHGEEFASFLHFLGSPPPPDSLAAENASLRRRLGEADASRALLEARIGMSKEDLAELRKVQERQVKVLREEMRVLRRALDEARKEKDLAEGKLRSRDMEAKESASEARTLREELEAAEAQRAALESCLVEMNGEAARLRDPGTAEAHMRASTFVAAVREGSPVRAATAASRAVAPPVAAGEASTWAAAEALAEAASLREENEALRTTILSLQRTVELLEEEKELEEEEMGARLQCREETICRLEGSMRHSTRSSWRRSSAKGNDRRRRSSGGAPGRQGGNADHGVASPDRAAGGKLLRSFDGSEECDPNRPPDWTRSTL